MAVGKSDGFILIKVSFSLKVRLLPPRASEQGNVIGLVSVYVYIYTLLS